MWEDISLFAIDEAVPVDKQGRDQALNKNRYLTTKKYNPPLEYDKLPPHLKKDPVHVWRAKTGIELIHKEPSLKELNRIWENWNLMTDEQKSISDKKSYEFFGKDNKTHYNELLLTYT